MHLYVFVLSGDGLYGIATLRSASTTTRRLIYPGTHRLMHRQYTYIVGKYENVCTRFRNMKKGDPLMSFSVLLRSVRILCLYSMPCVQKKC
jgi:hypothetical protein